MKEKGEGLWLFWDDVPQRLQDWLVVAVSTPTLFLWDKLPNRQTMNDPTIPFIRQYGEWVVLAAAKRTVSGWRQL